MCRSTCTANEPGSAKPAAAEKKKPIPVGTAQSAAQAILDKYNKRLAVNLLQPSGRSHLRRRLLGWFDENARDLPWRHSRDPYRIWVSEVMLQQTTVAAVIPYFGRFLDRFPTSDGSAAAEPSEVLRLWAGLGYYRRARDLHRAAQSIAEHHGGELPRDEASVRNLPGFGRYTANAVLSQAFDARLPILEANSVRLLCRLTATTDEAKSPATLKKLWQLSEELLPTKRIGDFNQALMELGAVVCTPKQPRCSECPLAGLVPSEGPRPHRRDTCRSAATKARIRSRDRDRRSGETARFSWRNGPPPAAGERCGSFPESKSSRAKRPKTRPQPCSPIWASR